MVSLTKYMIGIKTMHKITVKAKPLTKENFAKYGDVVDIKIANKQASVIQVMDNNRGSFGIVEASQVSLPYTTNSFTRHTLGTQAFVPLNNGSLLYIVAEGTDTDSFDINTVAAFIASGNQAVNYKVGVWHTVIAPLTKNSKFLIIERQNAIPDDNINITKFEDAEITVE